MFLAAMRHVNSAMRRESTIDQLMTDALRRVRTVAGRVGRATLASLLPPTCCLCGARGMDEALDLCEVCLELLPPSREATPAPPEFDLVHVPFAYGFPVDHLIRTLKFDGERAHARVLGVLLARARARLPAALPEALVPVPLHPSRYRERGFNQAHEIARFAARELGLRVAPRRLVRVVATLEQSGLGLPERRRNVRGAFRLAAPLDARHVALVDDVLTTGSTSAEAARVLAAAGVRRIELWAAARVALRGHRDGPPGSPVAGRRHTLESPSRPSTNGNIHPCRASSLWPPTPRPGPPWSR